MFIRYSYISVYTEEPEKKKAKKQVSKPTVNKSEKVEEKHEETVESKKKNKKTEKPLKIDKKEKSTNGKEKVEETPEETVDEPKKKDKKVEKPSKPDKKEKSTNGKEMKKVPESKKPRGGKKTKENEQLDEVNLEHPKKMLLNPSGTKWETIDFSCSKKNTVGNLPNLKISSWNIGGLKSWVKKDCLRFLSYENPDIMCLQETKCNEDKLPKEITDLTDYKQYWCSSQKEGYAGVGLLSKTEPINVTYGINDDEQDVDGRCITAEYNNFYVVCVYVPNAGKNKFIDH